MAVEAVVHRRAREVADGVVEVVHRHRDAATGRLEDLVLDRRGAVLRRERDRQRPLAGEPEVGGPVLVTEGVTADDDRLGPPRHQPRHVRHDDRLAEDHAAEDVADGPVRGAVHPLQAELLDARLVRRDGRALDPDAVALDGLGRVDRDLVVGLVALLDAEVVVLQVDVEVREDQLILDELPDDPGHLIAVEFDDGSLDLDLAHLLSSLALVGRVRGCCGHRCARSHTSGISGSSEQRPQRSATSACLARTASAASRSPASSLSVRSPSTTLRTPSRPISASTPRYTPLMPYSPSTQAHTGMTSPESSITARAMRAAAAEGA